MHMIRQSQLRTASPFGRRTPQASEFDRTAAPSGTPFFRHIIESSPTPILVIETAATDQPIVYANPAFECLLGYSRDQILGRDWRVFLTVHAPAGYAQPQAPAGTETSVEETLVAVRRDGTLLYFQARFSPVSADEGAGAPLVAVLHDVTAEHRTRETLEHRACFDPLTGLANRYLLRDRFEHAAAQAQRRGTVYTLALLDLDEFKQINDRFGHAAGDEALTFLGARLMEAVRSEDTVARLGGDEFVLLLMETDPASTRQILQRISAALVSFSPSGRGPLGLTYSAGVSQFPQDGTTLERLLEAADKRLYAAKA